MTIHANDLQDAVLRGQGGGGKKGAGKNADDTMRSVAHAVLIDAISEGPIVGLLDGDKSIYINRTPLSNIENSTYQFRAGHPDDEPVDDVNGTEAYQNVGVEISQTVGDQIRTVLDTDLDAVRIYLNLTHLYHVDSKGRMKTADTGWDIDVRPAGGEWQRAVTGRLISEKCTSPVQFQHNINIKDFGEGPWDIRIRAQYPDRVSNKTYEGIQWEGMSLVTRGRFTYPNTALVALNLSSEHVGSSVPSRHYHIRGRTVQVPTNYDPETREYVGVWDGTFKRAWTDNPAWVYYDIATSRIFGLGNELNEYVTNKWQLYGIAQHCDVMVPSGYKDEAGAEILEPRYTFNGAITDKKDAIDALRSITAAWRGMGFYSASQFHVTADTPQDVAHIYGPANVIDGRFEYQTSSAKSRHSVVMVRFNDANNFFESAIEPVIDNEVVHKLGWREKSVELTGCSSRSLARRYGKWIIDTEKNETETVTFSVGMDSIHALPGEVIAINDPRRAQVRSSGRIVETHLDRHIRLDQELHGAISKTNATVRVQGADGELQTFTGCTISEDGEWVDLGSGNASDDLIGRVFVLSAQNVAPKEFRIVSIDEQSDGATYQITALEFDRTKFARVEQGISFEPLPERVDLSVVNQVRNLDLAVRNYTDGGSVHADIELHWTPPVDTLVREYRVVVDTPSARSVPVAITTLNSSTYSASELGLYRFHVHTVNFSGRVSDPATIEYMVTGAAALGVGRVEDLVNAVTGSATGGFTGADLHLRWRNMVQVSDDPDVPLVEDDPAVYAGTLIKVYSGSTLLREQRVTGSTYSYSIEMNHADSLAAGFASARRSLRVEVSILTHDGRESIPTVITMTNPAPAVITPGVSVSGSSIILTFPEQEDTDYRGTLVWISENTGFTPSSDNLVFAGDGGSFTFAGAMARTYYIRVAGFDAFGREDLNISPEATATINISYDSEAPATPTALSLTTGMQSGAPWVRAAWDGGSEPDFSHFELSIREGAGGSPVFSSTTESEQVFSIGLRPNTEYVVAVRAVDFTGNRSAYTAEESILSAADTVAPNVPSVPRLTSGFGTIWIEWDRNTDEDFDYYEVAAGTATNPTTIVASTLATSHVLAELPDEATRYVRIRAVDTSGNRSAWTATVSKATVAAPDFEITNEKLQGLVDQTSLAPSFEIVRSQIAGDLETFITDQGQTALADKQAAEAARDAALAAQTASQGHASAASGHASTASTKATEAGNSASAAAASATAANTARTSAETFATQAAAAKEDAETAASSATTQAGIATTAANDAGDSASAAATSASTAAAKADEASTSASAASTAKTQAETARGQAQTFANNAASSATAASGSASDASTAAGVATSARNAAQGHASAASGHANTASTKATEAGTAASTATNQAGIASTQAGIATAQAGAAATSASNAAGAVNEASSYAQLAALALSGGMAKNPTFMGWTGAVPPNVILQNRTSPNGTATQTPGKYGNAVLFDVTSNSALGAFFELSHALGHLSGNVNPQRVLVTIEVEVLEGTPTGAAIQVGWLRSDTAAWAWVGKSIGSKLTVGAGIQTYQVLVERPANVTDATDLRPRFFPSYNIAGGTFGACKIKLHRFDVQEVVADSFVDEQRQTKATLDGLTSSTYLMRVKAGGAQAGFEMVAASDPNGSASAIRMAADELLFDGSVFMRKLAIGEFTNLIGDPYFGDTGSWVARRSDGSWTRSGGWNNIGATTLLRSAKIAGVVDWIDYTQLIPVAPGDEFYFSLWCRIVAGTGDILGQITFHNPAHENLLTVNTSTQNTTTAQLKLEGVATAPAGATYMRFAMRSSEDVTVAFWGLPIIRRKNGGELIVDGSLKSHHVGTNELITNTANIKDGIITNAKIVNLSAAKLMAGTALASTITVNGTALGQMTDPAGLVNTGTTQIDPGKIRITGSTTLADWRKGGDETKIDGGAISANTIAANKATIGMRGVTLTGIQFEHNSPAANQVSWTAGSLRYVNDSNSPVAQAIAAGSATWTAGTLFIYWVKGASTFSTTTNLAVAMTANTVILASYAGGTNLNAEYGRTVIDEDGIKTGAVKAHHIEVEELSAVSGRMGVLEVNDRLTITDSGALLSFKTGPYDEGDGLFFGQTGTDGFAFSAARTSQAGVRQSVDLRDTGFSIHNARHTVSGSISPAPVMVDTSQAITIPVGTSRISFTFVGAGGGGGRTNDPASPGSASTVQLRDGSTVIETWSASGGAGGNISNSWKLPSGEASTFAAGGISGGSIGSGESQTTRSATPGTRGSGGGGGSTKSTTGRGGMAGAVTVVTDYDISALSNPNLVFTAGIGGAGTGYGAKGGDGAIQYRLSTDSDIPADVVPLKPTAWGTITKTGLSVTFPDLGAGMWCLFCEGDTNMDIGWVDVGDGREVFCHRGMTTFVSSQTPVRTRSGWNNNKTIHYLFYRMGTWA